VPIEDPELGTIRVRASGTVTMQVTDPGRFLRLATASGMLIQAGKITSQIQNDLAARFARAVAAARIPLPELAARFNELGDRLGEKLQAELADHGLLPSRFRVEDIAVPPEVERVLAQRVQSVLLHTLTAGPDIAHGFCPTPRSMILPGSQVSQPGK